MSPLHKMTFAEQLDHWRMRAEEAEEIAGELRVENECLHDKLADARVETELLRQQILDQDRGFDELLDGLVAAEGELRLALAAALQAAA